MSFIRIKTRKNAKGDIIEYAYLVSNSWKKRMKMPRQKVAGYFGKIYRFNKIERGFEIGSGDFHSEIKRLIENELYSIGLIKRDGKFVNDSVVVDLDGLKVLNNNGKECVIMVNDGFICSWSLKKLFEIDTPKVEDASFIAKSLRMAGLSIDGENFVRLLRVEGNL